MKTIAAAQFKEHCLALLDKVGPEGLLITKHGKPVAKLMPVGVDGAALIGSLKTKLKIKGDVFNTGLEWNVKS